MKINYWKRCKGCILIVNELWQWVVKYLHKHEHRIRRKRCKIDTFIMTKKYMKMSFLEQSSWWWPSLFHNCDSVTIKRHECSPFWFQSQQNDKYKQHTSTEHKNSWRCWKMISKSHRGRRCKQRRKKEQKKLKNSGRRRNRHHRHHRHRQARSNDRRNTHVIQVTRLISFQTSTSEQQTKKRKNTICVCGYIFKTKSEK